MYIWKLGKMELYSSVSVIFTQLHPEVYPPPSTASVANFVLWTNELCSPVVRTSF